MTEYKGYVENIIFRNEGNGYTVFSFVAGSEEVVCVGCVPLLDPGETALVTGEMVFHPTFGEQLKLSSYTRLAMDDEESMRRYLSSGAIRGIGERLASRIIDHFGSDTARILGLEPERLSEVKGISERKAREIAIQYLEKNRSREAFLFLSKYGLSNNMAMTVYEQYGDEIYSIMQKNPYRLAEDIRGIGFKTADEIARRAGIAVDSEYRIASGILYETGNAVAEGNMYLPMDVLLDRCVRLLETDREVIENSIMNLAAERRLIIKTDGTDDEAHVYAAESYYTELKCAAYLRDLSAAFENADEDPMIAKKITALEKELGMEFDELQKQAVAAAATTGILIVTGGPGTGKTTLINAMIRYFADEGMDFMLAAPTGRAAKRMTEATGYEARTIHRMLELSGSVDDESSRAHFERNADCPLETDVVILDEMSMVDIYIFKALLEAMTPGMRLIMVGDMDQLPSVGPGQVLRDLIASDAFRVVMLERIFRQAAGSDIVMGAHAIRSGRMPRLDNNSPDFFFLPRDNIGVIYKHMVQLITGELGNFPEYVGATPFDMQVLSPMRKGPLGVIALNGILQEHINPPSPDKRELEYGNVRFREGDKVMQVVNNYQTEWTIYGQYNIPVQSGKGVFNGDLGRVVEISEDGRNMTVEYDECRRVVYDHMQFDELEPAYAVTIHKSQGSEYPAVIIPLLSGPLQLMNRNLLYTAITRARKSVMILGSRETLAGMIDNTGVNLRYTGLEQRIRELL